MTPKEKAKELVIEFQKQLFFHVTDNTVDVLEARGCALIMVEELINCTSSVDTMPPNFQELTPYTSEYWMKVKAHLEN
jgi:hypothetical protein